MYICAADCQPVSIQPTVHSLCPITRPARFAVNTLQCCWKCFECVSAYGYGYGYGYEDDDNNNNTHTHTHT